MRVLLDTHAFLWWLVDSARLSATVHRAIVDEGNNGCVCCVLPHPCATNRTTTLIL